MKPTLVEEPMNLDDLFATHAITEVTDAVKDLCFQNWPHISRILSTSETAKIGLSFSVEIDRSGAQPKITTRISYAEKHKDERESYIRDPRQRDFIEEGGKQ